jgi:threonine/homoserine/homoserine lactone efflux protein
MLLYLFQGLTFGFSASVSPGPFLAFLLSQTLSTGWRRSIWLALAPVVTDGPIIALALLVLSQTPIWFVRLLSIIGGFLLLYIAKGSFDVFLKSTQPNPGETVSASSARGSFLKAVAMNACNPNPYLFWATIGGPILIQSWGQSAGHAALFLAGIYLTLIGGMVGYILLFATASRIDPRLTRALNLLSAIALFLFGLYRLWQGIFGS